MTALWRRWFVQRDDALLADADICVKCGLCLPHCPTYKQTQDENESPRGRIALIQAWANGQLDASEKLLGHLDNCLLCRSCERVCPAVVPYSRLIDNFRSRRYLRGEASLALSLMKKVSHNKAVNRLAQKSLKFYQAGRLQKAARVLKLPELLHLDTIDRLLPEYHEPMPMQTYYAAQKHHKGDVGLFVGCMGQLLDHETVNAAVKLLTAIGFNVHVPEQQACCGALALHDGDRETAEQLAAINCRAFSGYSLEAIVTIASGCGSRLQEYQQTEFAGKVIDISRFLMQYAEKNLAERLLPLDATVCVHTPCSLKNVMRSEKEVAMLLRQIPGIAIKALPETIPCCGSAGSYMLDHAEMAQALLGDLLAVALEKQPGYLVSSNIGCALHIAAGLRERGIALEVLHPVALLARQLKA
ncbi:MAG: (Fe-S)-binding protein [Methylovulum sp.]|nr:MAG: (Fe-S)-binding protein [Methylovulum sp.]